MARFSVFNPAKVILLRAAFAALWPMLVAVSGSAQCVMACQQNVQVSLGQNGQAEVTPAIVAPFSALNCSGNLILTLFDAQQQPIPGNVLDCSRVNQTLNVRIVHEDSGNLCWGSVIAKDYLPPVLNCTQKFIACTADTSVQAVGFPTVSDNCTPLTTANLIWSDTKTDLPCTTIQSGQNVTARIDRTFSTQDAQGNAANCVQKIWLKRATLADVQFPLNRDDFAAPALACGQSPNNLALTGQPTVEGRPIVTGGDCTLLTSFLDQNIPGCSPGSFRVLRSWTVTDFCSNTFTIHVQVIKVDDKTPPTLTPPANLTVGTDASACAATVTLPQASATDACSGVTIAASSSLGNGYGPFANVPIGNHVITYTATDACGNSTTATMLLTVVDDKAPSAICKGSIVASLNSAGTVNVNATSFDNGSADNCQLGPLEASRDGGATFAPQIQFTCADVGAPVPVILKVTDAADLENTCNSEIKIRDNQKPTIQCPAAKTLTCQTTDTSPATTGSPLTTDNCGTPTVTFSDVSNLTTCNVGSITRTWQAADANGNSATCSQTITLTAVAGSLNVQFPTDKTLNACASPDALAPAATGQPNITGQSCLPPSVTFTDEKIAPAPPACFNILRRWKVIDWCVYNPNGGTAGIWEHTQIIRVHDLAAPVITPIADLTVAATLPGCLAQVTLPDLAVSDCSTPTVTNNSPYAIGQAANASGSYPVGIHTVRFTATDVCGQSATANLKITVLDQTPPTAVCGGNVSVSIPAAGTIAVPAAQLAAASTDNCTPAAALTFLASPPSVTCAQLGSRQITVTVGDATGNTAVCTATLLVKDDQHNCGLAMAEVRGTVRTIGNVPIANIPVKITADGFAASTDCSAVGEYFFDDLPTGYNYRIVAENRNKWMNGVSTFDLLLISKHLLGVQAFDSPYKIIAADANKSGSVTSFDILQIRKMILGLTDTLAGNSSWRFVPKGYQFPNPQNPFEEPFPEHIALPGLSANETGLDFVGIKIGDVNLSADATDARSPLDTVFLHVGSMSLKTGQTTSLPLKISGLHEFIGLQFELEIDPVQARLVGVEFPENAILTPTNVAQRGEKLAVSWDSFSGQAAPGDSLLCHILLESKTDVRLDKLLKINAERLAPEAYPDAEARPKTIALAASSPPPNLAWDAGPARPNPFRTETFVSFHLPAAADLTLTVSDALGRVVFRATEPQPAGAGAWRVLRADLPGAGVYFYQLQTVGQPVANGRMVAE